MRHVKSTADIIIDWLIRITILGCVGGLIAFAITVPFWRGAIAAVGIVYVIRVIRLPL